MTEKWVIVIDGFSLAGWPTPFSFDTRKEALAKRNALQHQTGWAIEAMRESDFKHKGKRL